MATNHPDPSAVNDASLGHRNLRHYNSPRSIAAMIAASNPGAFSMIAAPLLLSAFVRGGFTASQASTLCASELGGMTIASLISAMVVARFDRRLLVGTGLILALLGHALSILAHSFFLVLAARALAGFGVGTMFTTAVAGLAGLANPERAFGFSITTNQVATLILMTLVTQVGPQAGPVETVAIIAGLSALMGLAIPSIPRRAPAPAPGGSGDRPATRFLPPAFASVGLLAFSTAIGAVWPLVGQIGLHRGIAASLVDGTIAFAGIGAIMGGLSAATIGLRFGRLPIVLVCIACLTAAMLVLHSDFAALSFRMAVLSILIFWPLAIPYLLGTLAMLDPAGRWAALSGALIPCGMSLGGALAALIIANGDIGRVALGGAVAMVAAGLFLAIALLSGRAAR